MIFTENIIQGVNLKVSGALKAYKREMKLVTGKETNRTLLLAINRISFLRPRERLLLADMLSGEGDFLRISKKTLEEMLGRRLKTAFFEADSYLTEALREEKYLTNRNILCTFYNNADYPRFLASIYDPPLVLYYRGNLDSCDFDAIAVVGTRRPDRNGIRASFELGMELGNRGITVVSGLARGIDSQAHLGCVSTGGRAVAVLGTGVDYIYPASNRNLATAILDKGGAIVSEYPTGTPPARYNFPARNRIISGLAGTTVIVQAPKKSGALFTADYALDQGRDLFVHEVGLSEGFEGTIKLCADGAKVIRNACDLSTSLCNGLWEDEDYGKEAGMKIENTDETPEGMAKYIEMELEQKIIRRHGEMYWRT